MIITKRPLLVFHAEDTHAKLIEQLAAHQWEVHSAQDLQRVSDLIEKHYIYAGLCLIDKSNDLTYLNTIEKLFTYTPNINWIVGLPEESKPYKHNISKESELIGKYCYDYLVLPAPIARLLFALGHAYGMAELSVSPCQQSNAPPKPIRHHRQ